MLSRPGQRTKLGYQTRGTWFLPSIVASGTCAFASGDHLRNAPEVFGRFPGR